MMSILLTRLQTELKITCYDYDNEYFSLNVNTIIIDSFRIRILAYLYQAMF